MRVLLATAMYPTPDRPACGTFVRTQAEALKRAGVDLELLILNGRFQKLAYPKAVIQLRQRLSRASIDLVHAHYALVGIVARAQWQVPLVVTYHGDDLLGTINAQGRHTRLSRILAATGRLLAQLADAVIVQTKHMASRLTRANVYVIPHEVDLETFHPVDRSHAREILGLDPEKKYLLFAANPRISVKRFPLAKAAAEYISTRDPSVELLVVCKETQDRLALYMSACDALVFPSFQEGSPNIVKQAMACNLPIVATDVGDVREIIGQTKGCYICKPDLIEFADCLWEILCQPIRTQGREHIRHLDGPSVASRVIEVYSETLVRWQSYRHGCKSIRI